MGERKETVKVTKRHVGMGVVVLVALLVVGCESEETAPAAKPGGEVATVAAPTTAPPTATATATGGTALSVDEYVSWCSSLVQKLARNESSEQATTTYGEIRETFASALKEYQNVVPPDDLRSYHAGTQSTFQLALGSIKDFPDNQQVGFEALGWALLVEAAQEAAVETIPAELRGKIEDSECFVFSSADGDGEGSTPAASTSEPTPTPVPVGVSASSPDGWKIRVNGEVRGEQAQRILVDHKRQTDHSWVVPTPEAGKQFVMVNVTMRREGASPSRPDAGEFSIFGDEKVIYDPELYIGGGLWPDDLESANAVLQGGSVSGNLLFSIPLSEKGQLTLLYGDIEDLFTFEIPTER